MKESERLEPKQNFWSIMDEMQIFFFIKDLMQN